MASFVVDPGPHVPKGFELEDRPIRPHLQHEVFLNNPYILENADLAIVNIQPRMQKYDFDFICKQLQDFFSEIHQVRIKNIQSCAIGDAYVRFSNGLERERFLGPVFPFGDYSLSVHKQDEGLNARNLDFNHKAWVMLVAFPEDLRKDAHLAKAVSTFGVMVDWHEKQNLARVAVNVYLKADGIIRDSVNVNAGLTLKGKSWIVPVFVLKKKAVTEIIAKDNSVANRQVQPLPVDPASCSRSSKSTMTDIGGPRMDNTTMDNYSNRNFGWNKEHQTADEVGDAVLDSGLEEQEEEVTEMNMDAFRTAGTPSIFTSTNTSVNNECHGECSLVPWTGFATHQDDDDDVVEVQQYSDGRIHSLNTYVGNDLVCVVTPLAFTQYSDFGDDDDDVVEVPRPVSTGRRKRRAKKHRQPIDERFLRRSKRNTTRHTLNRASNSETSEPQPLAMISPSSFMSDPQITVVVEQCTQMEGLR